jgi:ATP-dependent Lon protease
MMNFDFEDTDDSGISQPLPPPSNSMEGLKQLPPMLPILPLRGLVVYPQTAVPLTIGQPRSIRLIEEIMSGDRIVGLLASQDANIENPGPEHLFRIGTAVVVHRMFRAPNGTLQLLIQGTTRFIVKEFVQLEPFLKAEIEESIEKSDSGLELEALSRNAHDQFAHIAELIPSIPRELVASINSIQDPLATVYNIANFQRMEIKDAQEILELDSPIEKFRKLVTILTRESEVLDLSHKIQSDAREEIEKVQRDYFLREQLKAIQKELGESDSQSSDVADFRKKIKASEMAPEAQAQTDRELERLSRLPSSAAEYGLIRSYIETMVELPWNKFTADNLDIQHAREVLETDHFGLKDVKERILEYLAVRKLKFERKDEFANKPSRDQIRKEREGVILCFIGPPGVGKTSLGQSIARALGRKFIRTSLGGMRDEAEIRGHRRTYIGALPGRIIQSIRRCQSRNPVFMLDEIDKLTYDFHGDPASALLEVLDPEQNFEFRDNYLEVAFDLSQVMFITTANQLESIPSPLLDRMEVIHLSGYTEQEKIEIAKGYLIPRQLRENGLRTREVSFSDESIHTIIRRYTRESGVRNLEREIGSICRKVITHNEIAPRKIRKIIQSIVPKLLGHQKYKLTEELMKRTALPGVATGLAWTPTGGEVLFIEATCMLGTNQFTITGSVGDVMRESAQAALSYVRSHAGEMKIDEKFFENKDIHLHIPAGSQPKDGPSAGITIVTALTSLFTKRSIKPDIGMTGEISLRGQILPVGGIKEKMLAAHRVGLRTVFLPKENEADLDELPLEVKKSIHFVLVDHISQVLSCVFE